MKRRKYPICEDFKFWTKLNPPLNKVSVSVMQAALRPLFKFQRSNKECLVQKITIPFENINVNCLVYSPKNSEGELPCLIYYHGGGFVLPAAPCHYTNVKSYVKGANCVVVFVDYPLAPKHKFPVPVNASYHVYNWVVENAEKLNICSTKIAVGGDSAGGNISAIVSMMASDNSCKVKPCGQMLIYPAVGSKNLTKSMQEYTDTPMCNSVDYQKYLELYFENKEDMNNKYASAVNAQNYNVFPSTYIETAEFDCLRDEAMEFAELLKESGVCVYENYTKGTMHGYDIVQKSSITKNSIQKRIEFLNKVFE